MDSSHQQHANQLACDACRVKKHKCSRERPACSACVQNRRACHYSGRATRSPLTRVYLTSVERRLQKMETLFAQRLPDVNLEEAIATLHSEGPGSPSTINQSPRTPDFNAIPSPSATAHVNASKMSEAVPQEADGFDWQEDFSELADGMAALSVEPKGTGYLGSTAGVFFLRSLLLWMGRSTSIATAHEAVVRSPKAEEHNLSSMALQSLVSRQVMASLIDSYFNVYHVSYPFVHEATFRAQFHEIIPRPSHRSWQMLLSTVLALGAWCMNHPNTDLHDDLYHHALSLGEDESMVESGNLTFVQALILLSNLSQKRNKPNTGSNFLGLAVRMALSLGLYRELPDWDISLLQREQRRRVWWGLYIFDSGASTTFGRPILLPGPESMDVRPVLNIHDESLTPGTTNLPAETTLPTLYSGLRAQSSFHVQTNHISNRLLSASGISKEEALSLDQALDSWSKSLPSYFQISQAPVFYEQWYMFARSKLWWRFWNLRIILFLQVLLGRSMGRSNITAAGKPPYVLDETCRNICVEAAHLSIVSIHQYLSQVVPTRIESWYAVFFIFHASLVMVLAILADDGSSPELPSWQADLETVKSVFRHLLSNNPLAARSADILDRILRPEPVVGFDAINFLDPASFDFSQWPAGDGDLLSSFGWLDPGQGP